jgi:magnesium-transporting ATPase (P-type)
VKAVRDGEFTDISKRHIVPGDIYLVEKEIPCDSVLLTGDTLVN